MLGKVDKDSIIGDILDRSPDAARFFTEMGMHCLGCPAARGETVEEACLVHGVSCEALLTRINSTLYEQQP